MPIESLTSSKVDGDASYPDAGDQPHDDSDCGSEHSHGIRAVRKQGKYQGPKKKHGPSKRARGGKKFPGGDGPSQEGCHREMRFQGRDGPFRKAAIMKRNCQTRLSNLFFSRSYWILL